MTRENGPGRNGRSTKRTVSDSKRRPNFTSRKPRSRETWGAPMASDAWNGTKWHGHEGGCAVLHRRDPRYNRRSSPLKVPRPAPARPREPG